MNFLTCELEFDYAISSTPELGPKRLTRVSAKGVFISLFHAPRSCKRAKIQSASESKTRED